MKKILFLLAILPVFVQAQIQMDNSKEKDIITIGEIKGKMVGLVASLSLNVSGNDSTYFLTYKNIEYKQIVDLQTITFTGGKSTLDQLYNVLTSFYKDENKSNKEYEQKFNLGKDYVSINRAGMGYIRISVVKKGFFNLNRKEIDILFGLKK